MSISTLRSNNLPVQQKTRAFSLEIKRLEREFDHPHPFSSEVNLSRSYTSTPSCIFVAQCLIKFRNSFILKTLIKNSLRVGVYNSLQMSVNNAVVLRVL
jgi:hypothetical protein